MVNLVQRATSDMLSGPDWAMNLEICDFINSNPGRAKDIMKDVKKRLKNKNSRVQFLTLIVLETMIKNCGDSVHQQVVQRKILNEMVKMTKKHQKFDVLDCIKYGKDTVSVPWTEDKILLYHGVLLLGEKEAQIRDTILRLLDAWQEAFGGPMGRYPHYFMAYDELQHLGFTYPKRTDINAPPILTPPQTHPISVQSLSPQRSPGRGATSRGETSDARGLSLSEMQTARSGMEVLTEMLSAIDPHNTKALRDDVIVELVERCRAAERRVMQLVNSTSDEELLRQGLALNDDLQRILAKHDAIVSGSATDNPHAPSAPVLAFNQEASQLSRRMPLKPHMAGPESSEQGSVTLPPPSEPQQKTAMVPLARVQVVDLLSGESYAQQSPDVNPQVEQARASSLPGGSSSQPSQQYPNGFLPAQSPPQQMYNPQYQGEQFEGSTYVASWAMPNDIPQPQSLTPQQQAMINGSTMFGSPQQEALIFGTTNPPLISQPLALTYPSQPSSPSTLSNQSYYPQYNNNNNNNNNKTYNNPSLFYPQQGYVSAQVQPQLASPPAMVYSDLPAPPWSAGAVPPASSSTLYANTQMPFSPRQGGYPHFSPPAHIGTMDLASPMQNLSLYGGNHYLTSPQNMMNHNNHYAENSSYPQRRPASIREDGKPEDKLFKDLVDFTKTKK